MKKVHTITGKNLDEVTKKYEAFEKEHNVVEIKQHVSTIMFVFYDDTPNQETWDVENWEERSYGERKMVHERRNRTHRRYEE